MKIILALLPAVLVGAIAHSEPRIPIRCSTPSSEAMSREFEGFFNPKTMQVVAEAAQQNMNTTETTFRGYGSGNYTVANGKLDVNIQTTDVRFPAGPIHLSVDAAILTSTAQFEGQIFDQPVVCALYQNGLLADSLPVKSFDQVNLPSTPIENGGEQKAWRSSDGKFTLVLNKVPEFTGKHGKHSAHTEVGAYLAGNVVSDATDEPGFMYYLLYHANGPHRVVEASLDVASDVAALKSMFGTSPVTLHLFHPYGHNEPVSVVVDCTADTSCLIQAAN